MQNDKHIYLLGRLIRLYNIILKYHQDFTKAQITQVNIYASLMDVYAIHLREGFAPEHYTVERFEEKIAEFEGYIVECFQWYDLTWKNQKPF